MRDAARVQSDARLLHAAAAAELATHVIQHFVGLHVGMGVGHLDRFRMRVQHARGEGAQDKSGSIKGLLHRGRLVDRAGDRLEIVGIEGERIIHAVPADHVEWMMSQGVARQPVAVLDQDRGILLLVHDVDVLRPVQIALIIGSAHAELPIRIQVIGRNYDTPGRLEDEQIRLGPGVKFQPIGRAARHDNVIEWPKGQRPKHGVHDALALVNENDLVGAGITIKLSLPLGGPAAGQDNIIVEKKGNAAGQRIAGRLDGPRLEMMVPQGRFTDGFQRHHAGCLDLVDPGWRPQMVDDAISPAKTGGRDNFLVIDSFLLVARLMPMLDVALGRNRAELFIGRHDSSLKNRMVFDLNFLPNKRHGPIFPGRFSFGLV